jgi:hypothetical protein
MGLYSQKTADLMCTGVGGLWYPHDDQPLGTDRQGQCLQVVRQGLPLALPSKTVNPTDCICMQLFLTIKTQN